jgi:CDP-diacylglycerol--glycerol-3-phosphate 3-phosphatidyltransferase
MSARGLNPALIVTLVRLFAIPWVMALLLIDEIPGGRWWALVLFAAAAATDWVDGYLARSRGEVTVLGTFLDSLVDKLLITGVLVALIEIDLISAWAAIIIIAREFAVTGLRMVAVTEDLIIPANRLGKWKMASQTVAIAVIIAPGTPGWVDATLLGIALVLTILSGAYYFAMASKRLFPKASGRAERAAAEERSAASGAGASEPPGRVRPRPGEVRGR